MSSSNVMMAAIPEHTAASPCLIMVIPADSRDGARFWPSYVNRERKT